jgi:hypothetical protein
MWVTKIYGAYLIAILAWHNPRYSGASFLISEN